MCTNSFNCELIQRKRCLFVFLRHSCRLTDGFTTSVNKKVSACVTTENDKDQTRPGSPQLQAEAGSKGCMEAREKTGELRLPLSGLYQSSWSLGAPGGGGGGTPGQGH